MDGHWVFGGIERGTIKSLMVVVDDRSAATLIPIIQKYILPGTLIISDEWQAYSSLSSLLPHKFSGGILVLCKMADEQAGDEHQQGEWLEDTHINSALALIKEDFPEIKGLQSTLSSYRSHSGFQPAKEIV